MVLLTIHLQIALHNVFLYERYFKHKKYLHYVIGFIILWFSFIAINLFTSYNLVINKDVAMTVSLTFIFYIFGLGFYFVHKNIIERSLLFQNELLHKEEEIRYLKAQLNPHFLFNALNNLYGLALSSPAETPDKILELSELLRYQIESSQKEKVLLKDELHYIERYIQYELDRNNQLKIEFNKKGDPTNLMIAPLLFMPFIENAVKFSAETDAPCIVIDLSISEKSVAFKISNNYKDSNKKISGTNTGIANTKKRLALVYENKYELFIQPENENYSVNLTLFL